MPSDAWNALMAVKNRRSATAPDAVAAALTQRLDSADGSASLGAPATRGLSAESVIKANMSAADRFLLQRAQLGQPEAYVEVMRICGLPVVHGFPQEMRDAYERQHVLGEAYERGFRHHALQIDAILTYMTYGCAFLPIGVGWGKTLVTLEIAAAAFLSGKQRILLLVPSHVMSQLVIQDIPWARRRVVLHDVPFLPLNGSGAQRKAVAKSGRAGCYIMPYSALSTRDGEEWLRSISPQVIIGDEAHNLRHQSAARTKRLLKLIRPENKPDGWTPPQCVWLSGTITSKSVMDYYHLVLPMGENCPLPRRHSYAVEWAAVLDSDAEPNENNTGPIKPLIQWATDRRAVDRLAPECPPNGLGFRAAYRYRLQTNPVVVTSGDADIGVSLTLQHRSIQRDVFESCEGHRNLLSLMTNVEEAWLTPNGDEIEHAFHIYKWLNELSAGFYNELFWPDVETIAKRRSISELAAGELLDKAKEHHAVLQLYHAALRNHLKATAIQGMDTPMLIGQEFARNGNKNIRNEQLFKLWSDVHALRRATPMMPERDSRVVRVCEHKIFQACEWAAEVGHGIIWYYHDGVGEWLYEMLAQYIDNVEYCPAGELNNKKILESKGKIVIASISAHGTGKNLQFHQNQCFVQFPRSAVLAEQALGRLHRNGQDADELFVTILTTSYKGWGGNFENKPTFDELNFAAMLNDALYIHQSTGQRQKVIYCNYDPIPRVFSHRILEERGLAENLKKLSRDDQKILVEKFDTSLDPNLRPS